MSLMAKRIFRSLIKSKLRPFLLHELSLEQLGPGDSGFQLADLELNPEALQGFLPSTLRMVSCVVSVSVDFPRLLTDKKLVIKMTDVDVVLGKGDASTAAEPAAPGDDVNAPQEEVEELQRSIGEATYSLSALQEAAQSFDAMLREFDLEVENLTVQYRTYSRRWKDEVALVLKVPTVCVKHSPAEDTETPLGSLFAKVVQLPSDFSLFLYQFNAHGPGKGQKTMLADGPTFEGVGSDSLLPTMVKVIVSQQSSALHIDLDIALKSFRAALDPASIAVVMELLAPICAFPEAALAASAAHEAQVEPLQDTDEEEEYFSAGEDVTASQMEFLVQSAAGGESSDEFYDCEDLTESVVDDMMFQSILTNPPPPKRSSVAYNITFTIQQASLTLLHGAPPAAQTTHAIFNRPFALNTIAPPPVAPHDHTTWYLAGLTGSLSQLPASASFTLVAEMIGAIQYVYCGPSNPWAAGQAPATPDDFAKSALLNLKPVVLRSQDLTQDEATPKPLRISYTAEQKIFATTASSLLVELDQVQVVVDDLLHARWAPYVALVTELLQTEDSSAMESVPKDDLSHAPRHLVEGELETEYERLNSSAKITLKADGISVRLQSSSPDSLEGLLLDVDDLEVTTSSFSTAAGQEWDVGFSKVTVSLDRGYDDVTALFSSNKYFSANQAVVPIRITIPTRCPPTPASLHSEAPQEAPGSPVAAAPGEIRMMEDYDRTSSTNLAAEEADPSLPFHHPNKFHEGERVNPCVAPPEVMEDFYFAAASAASMKVVVTLPNSSVELQKENYDLLVQFLGEFLADYTRSMAAQPIPAHKPAAPSPVGSIVCQVRVLEGRVVLRELVPAALRDSLEEDTNSSFTGTFQNLQAFFVSNYCASGNTYLSASLEAFELRDASPQYARSLQVIQKPKFNCLRNRDMLSAVVEWLPVETMLLLTMADTSIHYQLGSDWASRLQAFFALPPAPGLAPQAAPQALEASDDLSRCYLNLSNITVDYLSHNPAITKAACIFYLPSAEGRVHPFATGAASFTANIRSNPELFLIDNVDRIADVDPSECYTMQRDEYLEGLGFRRIGAVNYLKTLEVSLAPGQPLQVTLSDSNATLHLCRDSYTELLRLYSDYSFFATPQQDGSDAARARDDADTDESTFFDATESSLDLMQTALEDYDPSQMTVVHGGDALPMPLDQSAGELPVAAKEDKKEGRRNPFDDEEDDPFGLPQDDDDGRNPFATIDLPADLQLDESKRYMVYGVMDEKDIPANAISLNQSQEAVPDQPQPSPNQAGMALRGSSDDEPDDEFVVGPSSMLHSSVLPSRAPERAAPPPAVHIVPQDADTNLVSFAPGRDSLQDELNEFTMLDAAPERNPVVSIRKDLAEKVTDSAVTDAPPMLGVNVIMGYSRERRVENILELPDEFPAPTSRISLRDFSLGVVLYDGRHWSSDRANRQSDRNKIEVFLRDIRLEMFMFGEDQVLDYRMGLAITDVEVYDKLEVSNRNMLLCYDPFYLRATGSTLVSVLMQQRTPSPERPSHAMLKVDTLPIRLNLDQDARSFLTSFFTVEMPQFPPSATFWDEIRLSDIRLQVDYKAKRLDKDPLNWCSLAKAKFRMKGITKTNVTDFSGLIEHLTNQWWPIIRAYALGLGPLGPLVNLSTGFANLFYKPYAQYQKNGRLFRGVKQGVSEFGMTLASESLNIGSKVASGSQMVLELTDDFLNMMRPEAMQTNQDTEHSRSQHPETYSDGLQQGLKSIQREGKLAYKHMFVVPVEAYQKSGTTSCVNAIVHAVPIAVIRPMIGVAEGAKQIGLGARNHFGSGGHSREETNLIYK